jgi:hypothetical protein
MKSSAETIWLVTVLTFFLANALTVAEIGKMEATGTVISIDPQGTAITISAKVRKKTMEVRTIVGRDTAIKVKGKPGTLRDINVGDTVTVRYPKADDFHAKEIRKE